MKSIAVIGSGFGGLAEAIRLQARGFSVTIFEKRERIGGRAYQLSRDGYVFDMGPSLITAPFIIERVFRAAGKNLSDYLDLIPLDPFYRIYYHDRSFLDYGGDPEQMKRQMAAFNEQDARNYERFFRDISRIYHAVITDGLGATPFVTLRSFVGLLPRAVRLGGLTPVYDFVARYFTDERHRFAFSFHPLFIGGSPFRSPSIYIMIPYLEREGGVWFARGGMYSLVDAFRRVFEELGGTIHTGAEVSGIEVHNGIARGVRVNGEFHPADAVVSNGDPPWVYRNLVRAEDRRRWSDKAIGRLKMSMSCFLLYIGTRRQYPQLKHHTLILSKRYRELVRDIIDRKVLPEDFSMYLHVPTRTDPSMAPAGCESMYVLIPVPHLGGGVDWTREGPLLRDRVLTFLERDFGLVDLRSSIEVLEMFTPADFNTHLNSHLGSAFSIEPRLTQSAYMRPHNRSEDVKGLYIVGGGTHPGAGVPGVLLSAEATEQCVVQDLGPGRAGTVPSASVEAFAG
jgi:phytoene desaturase